MYEREPIVNTEERLLTLGEQRMDVFAPQARDSFVPDNAVAVVRSLLKQDHGEEHYKYASDVIFGGIFSVEEAEVAIKYLQAMSVIKQAEKMQEDNIGFVRKVFLTVGKMAVLEEDAGDEIEDVKGRVEEFFGDPMHVAGFDILHRHFTPLKNN